MNTINEWSEQLVAFTIREQAIVIFLIMVFAISWVSYKIKSGRKLKSEKIATNLLILAKEDYERLVKLLRELGILEYEQLTLESLASLLKSTKLASLVIMTICFKLAERDTLSIKQIGESLLNLTVNPSEFNRLYLYAHDQRLAYEIEFKPQIFVGLATHIDQIYQERAKRLALRIEEAEQAEQEGRMIAAEEEIRTRAEKSSGKHTITRVLTAGLWARFRFQQ